MLIINAAKVQDIIRIYKAPIFLFQGFLLICTSAVFFVLNFFWKPASISWSFTPSRCRFEPLPVPDLSSMVQRRDRRERYREKCGS